MNIPREVLVRFSTIILKFFFWLGLRYDEFKVGKSVCVEGGGKSKRKRYTIGENLL